MGKAREAAPEGKTVERDSGRCQAPFWAIGDFSLEGLGPRRPSVCWVRIRPGVRPSSSENESSRPSGARLPGWKAFGFFAAAGWVLEGGMGDPAPNFRW